MTAGRPPSTTTSTSRPSRAEQLGHGLGAARHLALVEGRRRDARDAHEVLEVGPDLRHEVGHAVADLLDLVGGEGVVSHEPDPTRTRRPPWVGSGDGRQHLRRRTRTLARAARQPAQRRAPGDGHPPAGHAPAQWAASRPRRRRGPGHAALRLARLGHSITAVEPDERMRAAFAEAADRSDASRGSTREPRGHRPRRSGRRRGADGIRRRHVPRRADVSP